MIQKEFLFPMRIVILAITLILGFTACDNELDEHEIPSIPSIPPLAFTQHVEEAGTLPDLIDENMKYKITDLTLTGNLNGTDIRFIREMAGRNSVGNATNGKLAVLNLAGANIVSGGENYLHLSSGHVFSTSDNSIGGHAFDGCRSLTSVTIPNSVTSIGSYAFARCASLTSITIGNSLTSIGHVAFSDCTSLTSITIPNSVTSIGKHAFYNCTSLTSITIPNSVTSIESSAFGGCTGLTSITIPNNVTSIGGYAFSCCSSLTSVIIGNSVTSIGSSAFWNCTSLTSVTIGNSVTTIGYRAFLDCTSLTEIHSKNPTPPSLGSECFDSEIRTNCKLYVPKGSYAAYWWEWSFDNIIEE